MAQPLAMTGQIVVALLDRLPQRQQQPFRFVVNGKLAVVRRFEIGQAFPLRFQQVQPGLPGANRNGLTQSPCSRVGDLPAMASGIHGVIAYIGATLEISRVLSKKAISYQLKQRRRGGSS
jgi:hypothetical protein